MTFSDSASSNKQDPPLGVEPVGEVPMDPVQERGDGLLPVIAGDVGVQVEPKTLDPVLVRAVRRQEVKLDPVTELGQPRLRHAALVDDVVVEDHVNCQFSE